MSLNIKNEHTHALVRRLASLTGQSQTSAVEEAVRLRLEELEREQETSRDQDGRRLEEMRRIVAEFQADLTDQERRRMVTANEWLYDDSGLPS